MRTRVIINYVYKKSMRLRPIKSEIIYYYCCVYLQYLYRLLVQNTYIILYYALLFMFVLELCLYCIKNSVSNSYTACNYPLSDRKLQRCCYNNIIY